MEPGRLGGAMRSKLCWLVTGLLVATSLSSGASPPLHNRAEHIARPVPVDLELVLAVDVSGSITPDELALQRNGYAHAFRSSNIVRAIESGVNGRISVSYVEWGGPQAQNVAIPWTVIETPEDAETFAFRLTGLPLAMTHPANPSTSISGLLLFASSLFEGNETVSMPRRVIDVSGNGPNNAGPPVLAARNALISRSITINGLAVDLRGGKSQPPEVARTNQLKIYFETCVIGGPGAFAVGIGDVSEMEPAILRKLLGEIIASAPTLIRVSAAEGPRSMLDCLNPGQRPGR